MTIHCRPACAPVHGLLVCRSCVCLGRGSSRATGLHSFSWISYSSLPFPQTQLPSAAGAESEWPLHFTPEVASFQQWVSDPGVRTLSNLGDPSAQTVQNPAVICLSVASILSTPLFSYPNLMDGQQQPCIGVSIFPAHFFKPGFSFLTNKEPRGSEVMLRRDSCPRSSAQTCLGIDPVTQRSKCSCSSRRQKCPLPLEIF